jgi:hypothetical protein
MYTDKGLAIVMVNTEDKNSINFIDVAAGKFALSKNVNVDGNVQYLEVVPKGLLFKTDRAINILDLTTGSSVLNLPVQGKKDRAIVSANAGDRYYFYSDADQNVYEINKSAGTSKQLNSNKIEFKGGEVPEFIEARVGGVSLSSAQNVMLIGFDGTTKFNVYNPGVRTVAAALQNVNNALDMLNNITGAASASTQLSALTGSSSRNNYDRMNQAFASTGNASYILNMKQFGSIHNRAKASAKSNENVFMMTKVNDRSTLVGINKDTGEMKSTIPLARRDDNPMYQVDALSGLLFYAPKGKNLIGWSTSANAVSCFVTAGK